ncbi:TetR/AcrR family transcriptional regulator [Aestuariimicrobium soli]|uniref:TetR/AcrR family transcriptional regulator n=1 Tax=Aestuariimicrobium soli TaxID=2035834 RepID=UPI003EBEAEB9
MAIVTRPKVHDESLRESLIQEASRMIAQHGRAGLNLRQVATATGTSTTAIYSLFGSKDDLVTAVNAAAFDSFGRSQRAVPQGDDPLADLRALGCDYRRWALAHPHFYVGMFREASEELTDPSAAAMQPLLVGLQRCADKGLITGHVGAVAAMFWACVHGFVSLEIAGQLNFFPDRDQAFVHLLESHATGLVVQDRNPGFDPPTWLRQVLIRLADDGVAQ